MVTRAGKHRELSSTYQSFADTGPTYSYLDLSRARSDESLMWSAGEEAAALVAELRASLASPLMRPEDEEDEGVVEEDFDDDLAESVVSLARYNTISRVPLEPRISPGGPFNRSTLERGSLRSSIDRASSARSSLCGRSLSFTDLHSAATSADDLRLFCFHPSRMPYANHCTTPHHHSSSASSTASSRSATSTCGSGVNILGNGGTGLKRANMRSFGGSWRSLLKRHCLICQSGHGDTLYMVPSHFSAFYTLVLPSLVMRLNHIRNFLFVAL
ncbi:hypothetical protein SK128_018958 [Halocaridina rubra]|uniref:Uncharacterized protein n=1 Tax=Halocaridina rubra TaxID=373956 RepID=A0AAN8XDE9_HALRR